jgi:hypothetical protein
VTIQSGKRYLFVVALFVLGVLLWNVRVGAQGAQGSFATLLQITSPAEGTVVHPGQTVTVAVSPISAGDSFTVVELGGDANFHIQEQLLTAPPYQFSIMIPTNAAIGTHFLDVIGGRSGRQPGRALHRHLDVEPSVAVSKIQAEVATLNFEHVGERLPLKIWGTFSGGSNMEVTHSSNIVYTSGDTSVATVSSTGIVTAVGTNKFGGIGAIDVHYTDAYGADQHCSVGVSTRDLHNP